MALILEAKVGRTAAVPSEDGTHTLAFTPPGDVEVTVKTPQGTVPSAVRMTLKNAPVDTTFVAGAETSGLVPMTATLAGVTEDQLGTYTVTVGTDSTTLVLKKADTEQEKSPPDAEHVVEVQPGVYDKAFARATGVTAAVLGGALVLISLISILRFSLEAAQVTVTSGWVANTLADRIAGAVQLLALALGGTMLVAGAWQAALEVRGRLTVTVHAKGGASTRGVSPVDLGEAVSKVLEVLKGMRGTVATLGVGALVVLGALWSSASVATSSHGPQPSPTSPPSPTSTTNPSPPVSPNPSVSPAQSPTGT